MDEFRIAGLLGLSVDGPAAYLLGVMPSETDVIDAGPILKVALHRPWPLPDRPWQGYMRWTDLAFLHWPVPIDVLQPVVPPGLDLDLYDNQAWLGIVPFRMEDVQHRRIPPIPTAANFLEINVRTYVIGRRRPGVWFFSLDAASWLAVRGARVGLNLPYFHANMHAERHGDSVAYRSRRLTNGRSSASFAGRYSPIGVEYRSDPGTLDHWLTERYCLFGQNPAGRLYSVDVHHVQWPLYRAQVNIECNTLTPLLDPEDALEPSICHFAPRLDVLGWAREWLA